MQPEKIKNKGKGRIFNNELLERLSRTHPLVIYSIYVPVIVIMLYYGIAHEQISVLSECLLFIAGVFIWTLFEYIVHRFVFHAHPKGARIQRFVYVIHGIHHEYPRDKMRLFMPVIPSITLATIIFLLTCLLPGWDCLAFFPGFLFGYLVYGTMHYAMHAFAPPKFLKALWRNHSLHHYQDPDIGLGVSSVLWDNVFGTVPHKKDTTQIKSI